MSFKPPSKLVPKKITGPVVTPATLNSHENTKIVPNLKGAETSTETAPAPRPTATFGNPTSIPMNPSSQKAPMVGGESTTTPPTGVTRMKASQGGTTSKIFLNQLRTGKKTAEDLKADMARKMLK